MFGWFWVSGVWGWAFGVLWWRVRTFGGRGGWWVRGGACVACGVLWGVWWGVWNVSRLLSGLGHGGG
jgi:hypothetical protein